MFVFPSFFFFVHRYSKIKKSNFLKKKLFALEEKNWLRITLFQLSFSCGERKILVFILLFSLRILSLLFFLVPWLLLERKQKHFLYTYYLNKIWWKRENNCCLNKFYSWKINNVVIFFIVLILECLNSIFFLFFLAFFHLS